MKGVSSPCLQVLWIRISLMRIRISLFNVIWIRIWIQLIIKWVQICNLWPSVPPRLRCETMRLHYDPPQTTAPEYANMAPL